MLSLEEKVELLEQCVVHNSGFAKLALESQWDKKTRDSIFKIMDKYFTGSQDYSFMDVENDFDKIGMSYQHLKGLFNMFYENHQYITVLTQYLKTNFKSFGNVSSEYNDMYRELVL